MAVGVPEGLGAQVQVGGAQQRLLRRRQGIESGKKQAVDPVARAPVHPLGLGRAAGRGGSTAKLHSGRGRALGPEGLVVGGVELGKLAPQAQTALHELGGLLKAPLAEGLDFAQLAQGGVRVGSVAVELAKVAQNGRSPAQKLVQGIGMRPGHLTVGAKEGEQLLGGAGGGNSSQISHDLLDGPYARTQNRLILSPVAPKAPLGPTGGKHDSDPVQRNAARGRSLGDALQKGAHKSLAVEIVISNIRCDGGR